MSMLQIEKLNVWFGRDRDRVDAVIDATFDVAEGQSFGLVGESGSGKSTILRAIVGLAPTWSGHIAVAGAPIGKRRPKSFYKQVQMVFQDPFGSLDPRRQIGWSIAEPLRARLEQHLEQAIARLAAPSEDKTDDG